jgi:hypothetical protein
LNRTRDLSAYHDGDVVRIPDLIVDGIGSIPPDRNADRAGRQHKDDCNAGAESAIGPRSEHVLFPKE